MKLWCQPGPSKLIGLMRPVDIHEPGASNHAILTLQNGHPWHCDSCLLQSQCGFHPPLQIVTCPQAIQSETPDPVVKCNSFQGRQMRHRHWLKPYPHALKQWSHCTRTSSP